MPGPPGWDCILAMKYFLSQLLGVPARQVANRPRGHHACGESYTALSLQYSPPPFSGFRKMVQEVICFKNRYTCTVACSYEFSGYEPGSGL